MPWWTHVGHRLVGRLGEHRADPLAHLRAELRVGGPGPYRGADHSDRVGCTRRQHGGDLAGTYKVRSHRWISGSRG
ncbi:hypothetical protein ACIP39_18390 [Streptomyces tibetensis]|uniref:hypothetical protein n=1 Tax=Streptomyces tibetensis TaxID=2382123 RepID=UPI00381075CB